MKVNLSTVNFEDKFEKLLCGLVEGKDITNFSVQYDANPKRIQIMLEDWCLELLEDGTWDIL